MTNAGEVFSPALLGGYMKTIHLTRSVPEHAGGPLECDAQEEALESYKRRGWREAPVKDQKEPQQGKKDPKKDKDFRKEAEAGTGEEAEDGKPKELFVSGGKE